VIQRGSAEIRIGSLALLLAAFQAAPLFSQPRGASGLPGPYAQTRTGSRPHTGGNSVFTLVGSVGLSGVPKAMVLYQNGSQFIAYLCEDAYIDIVNLSNPAAPQVTASFAHNILTTEDGSPVSGYQGMSCTLYNNFLLVAYSRYDGNTTPNPIPTHFATFSLTNPLQPAQIGNVIDIQRSDSAGLYLNGNTGILYQSDVEYDLFSGIITQQNGDIWSVSLISAPANGAVTFENDIFSCGTLVDGVCSSVTNVPTATSSSCAATGTLAVANDPSKGGPYRIFPGIAVNANISYFASSNSWGGNTEEPGCPPFDGQLLVVDTTNPASPAITSRVDAPATAYLTDVAVDGETVIAVGDSTGLYTLQKGYLGTMVISSFNVSTLTSPVLLNSLVTALDDPTGATVVALGQNLFEVGNVTDSNGNPQMVLVDANNPAAPTYTAYPTTLLAGTPIARNGYLYALSNSTESTSNTLSVFSYTPDLSAGQIGTNLSELTFAAGYQDAAPASQALQVTSSPGGVSFSVASDSAWLSGGVTSGTTAWQINVTATPGTLAPGTYTGHLKLTGTSNTITVTVLLLITETGSPCDVNQDGLINVLDVQAIVNQMLGITAPKNDLNADNIISVADGQIDLNAVLGLGCLAQ
jgi:hypothetical protein